MVARRTVATDIPVEVLGAAWNKQVQSEYRIGLRAFHALRKERGIKSTARLGRPNTKKLTSVSSKVRVREARMAGVTNSIIKVSKSYHQRPFGERSQPDRDRTRLCLVFPPESGSLCPVT